MIVAALLLGGGTRAGFLSDALLQLIAVPLLVAALWRLSDLPSDKRQTRVLLFCLAVVLVPLIQLIPLPPTLWTALPGREPITETFVLLGQELPWRPISVSPNATWLSAISLVVPLSIFLAAISLDERQRRTLSLVVLFVGLVSVFLGLIQVSQGPNSDLRFFAFSNTTEAIGFFANRNHFAALLYALMLFAAAWATDRALLAGTTPEGQKFQTSSIIALIASFTILFVLVAAQAMARSRAGLALTIIALVGAFVLAFAGRRSPAGVTPAKLLIGATALAVMFAVQFTLYRIMERFTADPLEDARLPFAQTTFEAALAFMPFGSGMGTFVPVYAMYEKPQDILANTYANRAHNDLLELWLETGVLGLALAAIFTAWFVYRCYQIWRRPADGQRTIDQTLPRAATLIVGLLFVHSVVDYPLRTGAMMAVFAFACALMVKPLKAVRNSLAAEPDGPRTRAAPQGPFAPAPVSPTMPAWPSTPSTDVPERPAAAPLSQGTRWGEGIEWPDAWQKPDADKGPKDEGG